LTEFAVVVCLCVYLQDDNLVEVETCMRNTNHNRLFFIDCAVCWIIYCTPPSFFSFTKSCHPTRGSYSNRGAL